MHKIGTQTFLQKSYYCALNQSSSSRWSWSSVKWWPHSKWDTYHKPKNVRSLIALAWGPRARVRTLDICEQHARGNLGLQPKCCHRCPIESRLGWACVSKRVLALEKGRYRIWTYLSFIQHKSLEIVQSAKAIVFKKIKKNWCWNPLQRPKLV